MQTILVCDDDKEIVEAIQIYLEQEGYEVLTAYDGMQALAQIRQNRIDLLVIDVMMPKLDGIHATMKIREESKVPVIIISAKSEDADKILGLNIGADDYVSEDKPSGGMTYRLGGLEMDDERKQVYMDGQLIKMTPLEYNILLLLMKHPGKVFSSRQIYESIWNEDGYAAENTVAVHIRHIREKIEIDPKEPRYLKVVWGVGYKLEG